MWVDVPRVALGLLDQCLHHIEPVESCCLEHWCLSVRIPDHRICALLYQEVEELFTVECDSVVEHRVLAEVVYVVVHFMQTAENEPLDLSNFIFLHQLPFRRGE